MGHPSIPQNKIDAISKLISQGETRSNACDKIGVKEGTYIQRRTRQRRTREKREAKIVHHKAARLPKGLEPVREDELELFIDYIEGCIKTFRRMRGSR